MGCNMQIEICEETAYKTNGKINFCDNIHKNNEKLTRLRKSYETIRPRLLFLAKNEPNSPEYKELYYEAVKIFNTVEELIGPL